VSSADVKVLAEKQREVLRVLESKPLQFCFGPSIALVSLSLALFVVQVPAIVTTFRGRFDS
jgi:hypothetical protein